MFGKGRRGHHERCDAAHAKPFHRAQERTQHAPAHESGLNVEEAKKKPLEVVKPADLGVDVTPRIKTLKVAEPPKRGAGVKVPDVATLVAKLKNEAKVI